MTIDDVLHLMLSEKADSQLGLKSSKKATRYILYTSFSFSVPYVLILCFIDPVARIHISVIHPLILFGDWSMCMCAYLLSVM